MKHLASKRIERILDYEITYRSFTIEKFNLFVRQLLLKLDAFLGPRSVLVREELSLCRPLGYTEGSRGKSKKERKGNLHVDVRKGINMATLSGRVPVGILGARN